jgi:hypothetical protein
MKKSFVLIVLIFNMSLIYSQNEAVQTPDAILLNEPLKHSSDEIKSAEELNSIISKAEQQKAVDKIMNDTQSHRNIVEDALDNSQSKLKSSEYSNISQDDLYEDQPDGKRRAKYPFIPAGANTIEEVEQYFKEHPSEMDNYNQTIEQSSSSNESNSYSNDVSYSENSYDNLFSNLYGIIVIAIVIFFLIAEFIGRSKHIGRWWTFFLLLSGVVPGVIALISSPSAKDKPTKGTKSYSIWGWVSLVFGILNLVSLIGSEGKTGLISIVFLLLSYYLFELSKGKIINNEPKYYF